MSKKTLITSRDPKGRQAVRLFEDAYNKAKLDNDGAQRVNERGDEFQSRIIVAINELSVSNKFADEEVNSNYGYLSGYKPKSITEQCLALHKYFPGIPLRVDEDVKDMLLPQDAEAWFAIPRWEKIASTYGEAVQKVLDFIKQARNGKFRNYRGDQLGPRYLRQHNRTKAFLAKIGKAQKVHDILVIPAQFGIKHRGRSVRRAREVFMANEFGLGAFQIGCMLLTHPERLQSFDDLWIDCPGDEYSFEAADFFGCAPCFDFDDGCVRFATDMVGYVSDACGSISAFWQ